MWLAGLERLLAERGLVSASEIAAGRSLAPAEPVDAVAAADAAAKMLRSGGPTNRDAPRRPGSRWATASAPATCNPPTHTRLPRYVRGHVGTVVLVHGCHVFPDVNAHGGGEDPQWLYTVRFDGRELWGADADPTVAVSVDAFEPYLEPAA